MKPEQLYRLEQEWASLWRDGQALALLLGRQAGQRELALERLLTCVPPSCEVVRLSDTTMPLGTALWQQLAGDRQPAPSRHAIELLPLLPRHPLLLAVDAAEQRTAAELDEVRQFVLAAMAEQRQIGLLLSARPGFMRQLRRPGLSGLRQLLIKHWSLDRSLRPGVLLVPVLLAVLAWYGSTFVSRSAPAAPPVVPVAVPVQQPVAVPEPPRVMQLDRRLDSLVRPASAAAGQ